MNAVILALRNAPRNALVAFVRFYQAAVSPFLGASCRFTPTCSQYAVEALQKYGALKGSILAVWRIARCHPFGGHGYDPVRWFGEGKAEKERGGAGEREMGWAALEGEAARAEGNEGQGGNGVHT